MALLSSAGFHLLPQAQGLLFCICFSWYITFPLSLGSFFSIFPILKKIPVFCLTSHAQAITAWLILWNWLQLSFCSSHSWEAVLANITKNIPPCLCSSYLLMASTEKLTLSLKLFPLGIWFSLLSWFSSYLPAYTFSGFSYLPASNSTLSPLCSHSLPSDLIQSCGSTWCYTLDRVTIPKPFPDQTSPWPPDLCLTAPQDISTCNLNRHPILFFSSLKFST